MKFQKLILTIAIQFILFISFSQENKNLRDITIKINSKSDTMLYLISYYGDRKIVLDSAYKDKKKPNYFQFKNIEALPGIYLLANQNRFQLLEFVIDKSNKIFIESDTFDIINRIKVKNSPESEIFFNYVKGISKLQKELKMFADSLTFYKNNKKTTEYQQNLTHYQEKSIELRAFTDNYITLHPNELFTKSLKMNREIFMPNLPRLEDGRLDSAWGWYYYKAHFWDNVDFTDERMLRTPIFFKKFKTYIEDIIYQHPDSLKIDIDHFVESKLIENEFYKFIISWLTNHYEKSNVVGFDAVFVHLAEKYFINKKAYWISENDLRILSKRSAQVKKILIGEPIPELIMPDTAAKFISNLSLKNRYVIMWFWDTDCSHCALETPILLKYYNKYKTKLDLEVYAVSMETNLENLKQYIKTNNLSWINVGGKVANIDISEVFDITSTPSVFVFDEKRKIILKNIPIEYVFENLLRINSITFER